MELVCGDIGYACTNVIQFQETKLIFNFIPFFLTPAASHRHCVFVAPFIPLQSFIKRFVISETQSLKNHLFKSMVPTVGCTVPLGTLGLLRRELRGKGVARGGPLRERFSHIYD